MQRPGKAEQVGQHHQPAGHLCQRGCQRRPRQSHLHRKDENIVEHDIDQSRDNIAQHRKLGRSVQSDDKHPDVSQHAEYQEWYDPIHILEHRRKQLVGTP